MNSPKLGEVHESGESSYMFSLKPLSADLMCSVLR